MPTRCDVGCAPHRIGKRSAMSNLEAYRTDHLILLVGGNPLPNYVAARVLARQQITLVHSSSTEPIACRLRKAIEAACEGVQVDLCPVDESRAPSIYNGVRTKLQEHNLPTVGLHYTGGTKAMAVHAYRAIAEWSKKEGATFVASYLDARTQELVIDDERSPQTEYVGDKLSLTLDEMLNLHGWTLKHPPCKTPLLPRTAWAIAQSYASDNDKGVESAYQRWKETELYPACKRENSDKWRSKGELKKAQLAWPAGDALADVTLALKEELNQSGAWLDIGAAYKQLGMSEAEDFCRWLDGLWPEHYLLSVLQGLSEADVKPNDGQVFQGVKPKEVELDLDVAAIVGYQLFAFSCGTTTGKGAKAELKHKLFEAILRARQLGGDQARVALVSVYNDPSGLQAEARQQIDPDNQTQIRVFGCHHLANLGEHLEHWIREHRKS